MAIATGTAIALAGMAAKAGTDIYSAKKQANALKASGPGGPISPAGTQARDALYNQAGSLNRMGSNWLAQGDRAIGDVTNYWSPLLRGDRAAIDQKLAPEMASITDIYRGAGRNLDRSGVRGAQRDQQYGELNRQRASSLALLRPQARNDAALNMATIGQGYMDRGLNAVSGAGNLLNAIYGGERGAATSAYAVDADARNRQAEAGQRGYAGLLFNMLQMYANRGRTAPRDPTGGVRTGYGPGGAPWTFTPPTAPPPVYGPGGAPYQFGRP